MQHLYFAQSASNATGTMGLWPANSFTGIEASGTATSTISFKSTRNNSSDDTVLVTHGTGKHKEVARALAIAMNPTYHGIKEKVIVFADQENGIYFDAGLGGGMTGTVTVTLG